MIHIGEAMLADTVVLEHAHQEAGRVLAAMVLATTVYVTRQMVVVAATWAQTALEVRDDGWVGRRIGVVRREALVADVARPASALRQYAVGCHFSWHTRLDGLDCRDPAPQSVGVKTAQYSIGGTSPNLLAQSDT